MKKVFLSSLIGISILAVALGIRLLYPADFSPAVVSILKGTNAGQVGVQLEEQSIIRSSSMLRVVFRITGGGNTIVPGDYSFKTGQSIFTIASRISKGDFMQAQKRATIPEGSSNQQIATIIKKNYPNFSADLFLNETEGKQGYLFPDTYFFSSTSTKEIISIMSANFDQKTAELKIEAEEKGLNWNGVVIMASILEEEADTLEDFALVSGVLWKRLEIGMPLQVDVSPITYEVRGFPAEPLSNPGINAIRAAINPRASNYLFYITGKDGKMYYAENFDIHRANIEAYLR